MLKITCINEANVGEESSYLRQCFNMEAGIRTSTIRSKLGFYEGSDMLSSYIDSFDSIHVIEHML